MCAWATERHTLGNVSLRTKVWSSWTTVLLEEKLEVAAGLSNNAPLTSPSMQPYQGRPQMAVRRLEGPGRRDPPRRRGMSAALAGK